MHRAPAKQKIKSAPKVNKHRSMKHAAKRAVMKQSKRKMSTERVYGNLSDQDRIFTNLYGENDTGIKGALKRVCSFL